MSVTPVKAGGIEKKEINQLASTSTTYKMRLTSVPVVALTSFIFVSREKDSHNSASLSLTVVDEINAA